ncbi:MAG: pyridoxal-phosphate dependent enzyme, partial [Bacteroidetes bacterium]|nr:pyridoxal-phosphate dependent enzyme [Bacteroidota bacterium]
HLEAAREQEARGLLSFGGAWSNHIVAVAAAAKMKGMASVGIIRGEKPALLSDTLQEAGSYGMELVFSDRAWYKAMSGGGPSMEQTIAALYPGFYMIPEGGSGEKGVLGAAAIRSVADMTFYTHILCAIGTGTMFAGLAKGLPEGQQVWGIPVLKGDPAWAVPAGGRIIEGYHQGGYARKTPALLDFMNFFYDNTGIPTNFIYTGKLLYAVMDMVEKGFFGPGSRLLAIHSGGLQGNRSLPAGTLHF